MRWEDDEAAAEEDRNLLPTAHVTTVLKVVKRQSKRATGRKARMTKFGNAKDTEDDSNVTIVSDYEVKILGPEEWEADDRASQSNLSSSFAKFREKQKWRALQRKYGMEGGGGGGSGGKDDEGGYEAPKGGGLFGKIGTKYVPPGQRGEAPGGGAAGSRGRFATLKFGDGGGGRSTMDRGASLCVSNVSEDTTEADMQTLFERFGRIVRIHVVRDHETGRSRGFAFVVFSRREDAERAMEALHGYGYDHMILNIEWAKSSNKPESGGDLGSQGTTVRSGYGRALPQDKENRWCG